MKKSSLVLFAWSVCMAFIRPVEAQETNNPPLWVPPTRLESFETNTSVVIIKGSTDIGNFSVNTTRVAVKAKEYVNVGSGDKQRGLAVDIQQNGRTHYVMLIDYDEIVPLMNAMDYLNKLDPTVTPLNAFDAVYVTKGGFRLVAVGARRTGAVQFAIRDNRFTMEPVIFSRDELSRLRSLTEQAKKELDAPGDRQ
jgi:hypothetical protein